MRFVPPEAVTKEVRGKTVVTYFRDTVAARRDQVALRWRDGDKWGALTWGDYADRACRVAAGLASLGVTHGDRVTLMLRNCPEFHIFDMAALLLGATPTSLYYTSSPEQVEYQLRHAESSVVVVDRPTALEKVCAVRANVPTLRGVVCVDDIGDIADGEVVGLDALFEQPPVDLAEAAQTVAPEDIATIIYTSGTTGPPKGVMISHFNVAWAIESLRLVWGKDFVGKRVISYLPTAHVADRLVCHWLAAVAGFDVTDCPEAQLLGEYLLTARPHFLMCPPRFWEKLYQGMRAEAGATEFDCAVSAGKTVREARLHGGEPPHEAAEAWRQLAPKVPGWKALVGLDALEIAYSSAAPGNAGIIDAFAALGTPLSDGYGMSETTSVGALDVSESKPGTVGRPLPGVELKLAEDHEILIRCGSVMVGYLKDPEKTAEAIDGENWLHTGDLGEIDEEGYLRIVGRKKELIINAYGKNVSPVNVELSLATNPLFAQVVAIGDARKFITALFVLAPDFAPRWAKEHGISFSTLEDLACHPAVLAEAGQTVSGGNESLSKVEQVKRFRVLAGPWLPDSDVLTALSKLKRRNITVRYADEIEQMYADTSSDPVQVVAAG